MSPREIFQIQLALGYVAAGLFVYIYWWPRLAAIDRRLALRQIAMLNAFRFEGLLFIMPGFVGPGFSPAAAVPAAYGDFATSLLAIVSIVTFRWPRVSLAFTALFTLVGTVDLINNIYRVVTLRILPADFGLTYAIPILYVPILLFMHGVTVGLLMRRDARVVAAGPIGGYAATPR